MFATFAAALTILDVVSSNAVSAMPPNAALATALPAISAPNRAVPCIGLSSCLLSVPSSVSSMIGFSLRTSLAISLEISSEGISEISISVLFIGSSSPTIFVA